MRSLYEKLGAKNFFTAAFALLTALCLIITAVISILPSGSTAIDLTEEKLYTLNSESISSAKAVKDEVTLYLIASAGSESKLTLTVLERYARENRNIKVKVLYAETDKDKLSEHLTYSESADGGIIVESAKRALYIPNHLLLSYSQSAKNSAMQVYSSYYSSGETDLTFSEFLASFGEYFGLYDGYCHEERINSALRYVTAEKVKKVCFASGSADSYFSEGFRVRFADNLTELSDLALDKESIPNNADAVLLMPMQTDITKTELDKLSYYVDNGGYVLLMSSYGVNSYPNLSALCAKLGLSSSSSYVFEDVPSRFFSSSETLITDTVGNTASLLKDGQKVLLPLCTEIKVASTLPSGISVSPIFTSSADSYVKNDLSGGYAFNAETDARGSRLLGVNAVNASGGGIVYVSSSILLVDDFDYYSGDANKTAFFGILNSVTNNAVTHTETVPVSAVRSSLAANSTALYSVIGTGVLLIIAALAIGMIGGFKRNK